MVETTGNIRERLAGRHTREPLARGEGLGLSMELLDQKLGPCEGLQRGLGEACTLFDTLVKIPESSMGVCISTSVKLPHLYCYLVLTVKTVTTPSHTQQAERSHAEQIQRSPRAWRT
jgi:hypothetical protein